MNIINKKTKNKCFRVYPKFDYKSLYGGNYDPLPFLHNGVNFVSMNMCTTDDYLNNYLKLFSKSSFIKIS
jgi:hypothetical protein